MMKEMIQIMTMINPKILILPDIHGRKFYCNALCEAVDKGAEIVCLGDYLDPKDYLFSKQFMEDLGRIYQLRKYFPSFDD